MDRYAKYPTRKLVLRIGLRFFLIIALVLFLILLLPPLLNLFLPFILAFVAATMLAPLVQKITKKMGTARSFWSMLLVLLLLVAATALLVYLGYYLVTQVSELYGSWSSIQANFTDILNSISAYLQRNIRITGTEIEEYALDAIQQVVSWITDKLSSWAPSVVSGVGNLASGIASFLIALLFFIVGAYFMTADYPRLRSKIRDKIPRIIQPHMRHLKGAMGSAMFGYLRAQLILSGIVTLITFAALLIQGQDYALIIALICGIIDLVPFFGSGTVLVPWAVVELFLGHYSKMIFLLVLAIVLFVFRKIAEPRVVGNQTGLSPLASLISIYVGMKLGGVVGMILVPILCMILYSLYCVGFFDPTIEDFRMLFYRIIEAVQLEPPEESNDPADPDPPIS